MTSIRSRISKGRALQKRVSDKLKEAMNLGDDDIRPAIGSETGPDVVVTSTKARERVPYAIECKNQKSMSIWAALEQTCKHCNTKKAKGLRPALIFKRGDGGAYRTWVCIELDEFIKLLKERGE